MDVIGLFIELIRIDDPLVRQARMTELVGTDSVMLKRVEELLDAHERASKFMETSVQADAAGTAPIKSREQPGAFIGNYKLLQQIGEGGMGTVWMADQIQPVQRRVALKLIRVDRGNSRMILSRFEAERQAIAMMDHPYIARLLDAGATADGSPYFVMELVKGLPLSEFCDAHHLSVVDRLQLFQQICSAVQHAHQKGIIHRDLKPSNILVESHDGKPVPKIIDFGVAKATSSMMLSENTLFTGFGNVLGTPLYMAPEQANFNALDIDTRADVYALGVILYELLTGSTPLTKETIKHAALDQIVKMIREHEAPTPSSRISSSEGKPAIAASRHSEPERLSRFVKGELDWIAMKAISKERERRYESASSFRHDIERFLNHEPVQAGPPSSLYRLKKFVRRNRLQVTAASLVVIALLSGVVGTTLGFLESRRQAKTARLETAAKDLALAQMERGIELLAGMLTGMDPRNEEKAGASLYQQLLEKTEKVADELEGETVGDVLSIARLQTILGQTLIGLGSPEKAIEVLKKAVALRSLNLGADHPDTFSSISCLAEAYHEAGSIDTALERQEKLLAARKDMLGPNHIDTLRSMRNLGSAYRFAGRFEEALSLLEQTLVSCKAELGSNHIDTLRSMSDVASAYVSVGRIEDGISLFEQALTTEQVQLGPEHVFTLSTMDNLAGAYHHALRLEEAINLSQQTLEKRKAKLGLGHPAVLASMNNLAGTYMAAGKHELGLPLFEQTLAVSKAKRGPNHPATLTSMSNLGYAYAVVGEFNKALPLIEKALETRKEKFGADHPATLSSMVHLAYYYKRGGKPDQALLEYEKTLAAGKAVFGFAHPETLSCMQNIAEIYKSTGKLEQAMLLYEQTLELRKATLGSDHVHTLRTESELGEVYVNVGKIDKARKLNEEVYASRKLTLGQEHRETIESMAQLAFCYGKEGNYELAVPLNEQSLSLAKVTYGPDDSFTHSVMHNLAYLYGETNRTDEAITLLRQVFGANTSAYVDELFDLGMTLRNQQNWSDAELILRESLSVCEMEFPEEWQTYSTQSMVGQSLLGQMKYAESEPFLMEGYCGLDERKKSVPPNKRWQIKMAVESIVKLYKAWHAAKADNGYDVKAAEWQKKLDEFKPATVAQTPPAT